jgi:hypothetical protein
VGRPKKPATIEARKIIKDVKAAAREMTQEALDALKAVVTSADAPAAARVSAATAILDRGCGKLKETVDVTYRGPMLEELVIQSMNLEKAEKAAESMH